MSCRLCEGTEPIPGYLLQAKLGAGGYGEVWKVSAPGGLTKAIKFVYGRMDDARAERELKSLGRIKEVRHPFLLSLERFDVVEGQLVVVTELADMSLMDRFRECCHAGLPGIPREELLGYIRDAADALDYMSDKYGLQHLDIKPENLLLVGGRVKVADFGLVKDLQDTHATSIGGVTPLYATPEAFDGRASRFSDQYSLAIVYQEMLTGLLPFPGQTAAQLAAQHLHSQPMLGPLPERDREAVARALAKQPDKRFPSCRQLADCLVRGMARMSLPWDRSAPPSQRPVEVPEETKASDTRGTPVSASVDDTKNCRAGSADSQVVLDASDLAPSPPVPLVLDKLLLGIRPTLFIGLGGTGARVLQGLRKRLHDRFGGLQRLPMFQLLLMDTDPASLQAAQSGEDGEALAPGETVQLPLRKTADYRAASDNLLSWLSRRWLYNIPRSLRTEGLRPLGRLAAVDHADRIARAVRRALRTANSMDAREETLDATGMALRQEAPRVFVIGSISGGTASGMIWDVARTARQTLTEMRLPNDQVCAILTHFTALKSPANDLRRTNAHAALTELNHFCQTTPSQNSAATPKPGQSEGSPVNDAYLVHLGDDLTEASFKAAVEPICDYLYLDAATTCGAALDQARQLSRQDTKPGVTRLRSIGLRLIGCDKRSLAGSAADEVCRRLIDRWRGESPSTESQRSSQGPRMGGADGKPGSDKSSAAPVEFALPDVGQLARTLAESIAAELGGNTESYLRGLIARAEGHAKRGASGADADGGQDLIQRLDAVLGCPADLCETNPLGPTALELALEARAKVLAEEQGDSTSRSILALVENPRARLVVARRANDACQQQVRAMRQRLESQLQPALAALAELRSRFTSTDSAARRPKGWFGPGVDRAAIAECEAVAMEYAHARLNSLVDQHIQGMLAALASRLSTIGEQLARLRQGIDHVARLLPTHAGAEPAGRTGSTTPLAGRMARLAADLSAGKGTGFLDQFDHHVQQTILAKRQGLISLAAAEKESFDELCQELRSRARITVLQALSDVDAASLFLEYHPDVDHARRDLRQTIEQANSRLCHAGGVSRFVVAYPQGAAGEKLRELLDPELPSLSLALPDAGSDLLLCQETEQIPLARVAASIIENRADFAAAARRVLTRLDVPWVNMPLVRDALPCATMIVDATNDFIAGDVSLS